MLIILGDREINNKPMRLSKLQKWILANMEKKPYEEGKALTVMIKGFSPKAYYYLNRRYIMYKYFNCPAGSHSRRIAEVVLARSLETMEKHGLIIRVKLWHMPLRQAEIIFGVTHDKSDKEIGEALKNIDSKAEMGWFERATGPNVKTQGIFLTDKGIEIRKLVLKELNLDLNKE